MLIGSSRRPPRAGERVLTSKLTSISSPSSPCRDRKSTRLNSSHVSISYAVFCLKKKNTTPTSRPNRVCRKEQTNRNKPERNETCAPDKHCRVVASTEAPLHFCLCRP